MIDAQVDKGKWLLSNVKHAAMATVNADGTPHNTPYLFMRSGELDEIYWGSHPKSLHSQNVERKEQYSSKASPQIHLITLAIRNFLPKKG